MTEREFWLAEYWLSTPLMIIGGLFIASGAANIGLGFAKNGVLLLGMVRIGDLSNFELLTASLLFWVVCTPDNCIDADDTFLMKLEPGEGIVTIY